MTDFRKFAWGVFGGMGAMAALLNHGYIHPRLGVDPVLGAGLMVGCLAIIWFGERKP